MSFNSCTERQMREIRWVELPEPIRRLASRNSLVHHIATQFAIGDIITKDEALCQMIVGLARDWDAAQKRACEDYLAINRIIVGPHQHP